MPRPTALLPAAACGLALACCGCISLQPFAAVRARLPADQQLEIDGQLVHFEEWGSGAPLLLLHGFGESTYTWRRVAPALAAAGRRVIAIDLNGFGYTERPAAPAAYTLDGQQRLVLGALDRLGVARADFAGHSYGGGLALWIAVHHPERVHSMVLIDTAMPLYSTTRRSSAAKLRPLSYVFLRTVALRMGYVQSGLRNAYHDDALATDEVSRQYLDRLRIAGIDDAYYGLSAKNDDPPAVIDLAAVKVPALLVWGREDTLTPLHNGERITAALPDARLVILADCGHVPMEEQPTALVAAMLPFLAAQAP